MLTVVLPPGGGGVVGPVGVLLPLLHADANTPNETMHANLSDDKDIEPRNPNLAIGRAGAHEMAIPGPPVTGQDECQREAQHRAEPQHKAIALSESTSRVVARYDEYREALTWHVSD